MANDRPSRPRTSGIFSGLLLILFGLLLLLHNYGHLAIGTVFKHWWPLVFIFWGLTKLYERTLAQRQGRSSGWITPGEVFLVLGLMAVVGLVVAYDVVREKIPDFEVGEPYSFDLDVPSRNLEPNTRLLLRTGRGNIAVRSSDDATLRISGQKEIRTFSKSEADARAAGVGVEVQKNGDSYEIRPSGYDLGDTRVGVNMEVVVPKKALITARTDRGTITVSDMTGDVTVASQSGDLEVNDTTGNVDVSSRKGDVKVTDTRGDVKVAGRGGDVDVVNATGSLVVDGEYFGSVRADKIAKGVRFLSQRTDLTLTQLGGHFEKSSGNLEVADAPGNLTSRTRNVSLSLENVTGKIVVDNTNGPIEIRFSNPPKEDITVNNERSSVTIAMPASSSFEIQADCRSCDINSEFTGLKATRTEKGDTHLEGKYGAARGPKIVIKSSYDTIEIRKTT